MPAAAVMGAASVGSAIVGGISGNKAAKAQKKAAQAAAAAQAATTQKNVGIENEFYNKNYGLAQDTYRQQLDDNSRFYNQARGDVTGGYDTAAGQIGQGYGQAIDTLSPFASSNSLMSLYDMAGVARPGEDAARAYNFQASDPSYAWRFNQGQQAIDRSAASRGMLLSGSQLKASQEFGQGMASQEYGNQFNRLSGLAQNAQNAAGNIATLQQGRGTALASNATARGTALGNMGIQQGSTLNSLGQTNLSNLSTLNTNHSSNLQNLYQTGTTGVNNANQDAAQARASGYLSVGGAIQKGIGGLAGAYNAYANPATGGMYGGGYSDTQSAGRIHWYPQG